MRGVISRRSGSPPPVRAAAVILSVSLALTACASEPAPFCALEPQAIERPVDFGQLVEVAGRAVFVTQTGAVLTLDENLAATQIGLLPRDAFAPTGVNGELIAVGDRRLVASRDLGRTWSERRWAGLLIRAGDRLYAVEDRALSMSLDGGVTWTVRGTVPERANVTAAVAERVFAGSLDGVLVSLDAGQTFSRIPLAATRVLAPAPGLLLADGGTQTLRSLDDGDTWTEYTGPTLSLTGTRDALYATRDGRLLTSADRGDTWNEVETHGAVSGATAAGDLVAFASDVGMGHVVRRGSMERSLRMRRGRSATVSGLFLGGDDAIYAVFWREGADPSDTTGETEVRRSDDGGERWQSVLTTSEPVVAVLDERAVYALREGEWRYSDDGGATFATIETPTLAGLYAVAPFAAVDRTAYAIGYSMEAGGAWFLGSTDGGPWRTIEPMGASIYARGRDRSGRLLARESEGGEGRAGRWDASSGWSVWPLGLACDVHVIGDEAGSSCQTEDGRVCLTSLGGGEPVCRSRPSAYAGLLWAELGGERVIVSTRASGDETSIALLGEGDVERGRVPVSLLTGVLTVPDGVIYAGTERRCDGTTVEVLGRLE